MNQEEIDKEYNDFIAKLSKKEKEFLDDFNKLSPENKRRFQNIVATTFPGGMAGLYQFLNTKF